MESLVWTCSACFGHEVMKPTDRLSSNVSQLSLLPSHPWQRRDREGFLSESLWIELSQPIRQRRKQRHLVADKCLETWVLFVRSWAVCLFFPQWSFYLLRHHVSPQETPDQLWHSSCWPDRWQEGGSEVDRVCLLRALIRASKAARSIGSEFGGQTLFISCTCHQMFVVDVYWCNCFCVCLWFNAKLNFASIDLWAEVDIFYFPPLITCLSAPSSHNSCLHDHFHFETVYSWFVQKSETSSKIDPRNSGTSRWIRVIETVIIINYFWYSKCWAASLNMTPFNSNLIKIRLMRPDLSSIIAVMCKSLK